MGCKDIGIRKLDFFLQKLNSFKGESVQKLKGGEPSPPPPSRLFRIKKTRSVNPICIIWHKQMQNKQSERENAAYVCYIYVQIHI